jgi:hypothetical protein
MKKVPIAMIFSAVVLGLTLLAFGQRNYQSLDYQLLRAAESGDTAAVQQLLQKGAHIEFNDDPGVGDGQNRSALCAAAYKGQIEVVKLLLEKGANLEFVDAGNNRTALYLAAQSGKIELVKLLMEKGAKTGSALVPAADGATPK